MLLFHMSEDAFMTKVIFRRDAEFTLTAVDDFRHVQLTFVVNGKADGKECELRWRETDPRFPLGKIISTYRKLHFCSCSNRFVIMRG